MMEGIFLLLGSNIGDRMQSLADARKAIERDFGRILKASTIHVSSAWGITDQPDFLNQVIEIRSEYDPHGMMTKIQEIEVELGRVRFEKWGPRMIDIDILYFGDKIISEDHLTIPHPEIPHRRFTLEPLKEIAPDLVHPVLRKTQAELLEECNDPLTVHTY